MCDKEGCCCQKPKKLTKKPQDCTPRQVKECHGDAKTHACETPSKKR